MAAVLALAGTRARAQVEAEPPPSQALEATLEPQVPAPPPAPDAEPAPPAPMPQPEASPPAAPEAAPAPAEATPSDPASAAASPSAPADPVVALIGAKLADPAIGKDVHANDLAALASFYAGRQGRALWITEMGFSAKAHQALFEIEKAGDFGLDAAAFDLPPAGALPANPEAQALAEIKLDLAILKYARFARGGRLTPSTVSPLFDQTPPLRDPRTILTEIETAEAPDAYLRSLHPAHEQFVRLRQALLKARGTDGVGEKPAGDGKDAAEEKPAGDGTDAATKKPDVDGKDVKRILINMERWRWMPEDLGSIYVMNNAAAFMLYIVKDGKTIFADKTLVGTIGYATPIFTAPMTTIVFNPEWNAPETVVKENILPPLQRKHYSILKSHKLFVSYNGRPVDATKVDWNRVDGLAYTFTQKPGPHNNLGKVKFLYPNRHTVYMHDTLPVRKKYFKQPVRLIGHECVRMEKPDKFASVFLAESNGWGDSRMKELWDKGVNSSVALERKFPVHMAYFTAVADEAGKVETFADVYGLDRKLAVALFGDATGFPQPPPESKQPPAGESDASTPAARRNLPDNDVARAMQGFLGD